MFFYYLFSICYFLVSWFKPKWALFLICALLPTYQLRFEIFGLPTTFLEVMIVVLFITRLLRITNLNEVLIKLGKWKFLIKAWLLVGLIAVFVSPDKWLAFGHWRAYFLEPILLLLVVTRISADQNADINENQRLPAPCLRRQKAGGNQRVSAIILLGLSVSALLVNGWAIYQKIIGQGMISLETWQYPLQPIVRSTGLFVHSNFLGLFLGPLIVLFFGLFLFLLREKKLLLSIYYLLVSLLSFLSIIFARSEGAILAVFAGLIFFLFFYFRRRQRLIFVTAFLIFLVFLLFLSPWREGLGKKISFQDLSLQLRLNIWQGSWQMIQTHPFFGVGLRGYQQLVDQYQQPFVLPDVEGIISNEFHPYPHNLFLTLWLELGILGSIVFLLIIIQFFRLGFKKIIQTTPACALPAQAEGRRTYPPSKASLAKGGNTTNKFFNFNFSIFILAAMVVILVHGCVDTPYFKNDLSILFWLIIGLLMISKNLDFSSKSEKIF